MEAFPRVLSSFSSAFSRDPNGDTSPDILSLCIVSSWVGCADTKHNVKEVLGPGLPFSSIASLPKGRAAFNVHIGDIYPALMEVYYVWTRATMLRKEMAGASLRYAEDLRIAEDWECFARLAKLGPAAYLDCELTVQNAHEAMRLTGTSHIKQATGRITILYRVWGRTNRSSRYILHAFRAS
jgi:hypothetical protein